MKNPVASFLLLSGLVGVLWLADLLVGTSGVLPLSSIQDLWATPDSWSSRLITDFRFPKSLTAIFAGIALSVSGLQMQTLFRNPLAGPYVLGISSGASLGVALVVLGFSPLFSSASHPAWGNWTLAIASWIGSGTVLVLVFAVSMRVRDIMTVLVLGILFAGVTSALVSILQFFSPENLLKSFVIWTMGSLGNVTYSQLGVLIPVVVLGLFLSIISVKALNISLFGEEYSRTVGINPSRTRLLVFGSTSLLAGTVTAFCGPLGFIGIAAPHLGRMLFQTADHRILLPAMLLMGPALMLVGDLLSQLPGLGGVLPINSVTSLLGIPILVWIILRNQTISTSF